MAKMMKCYMKNSIMLAKKSATSKVDFREGITFPLKPDIGRSMKCPIVLQSLCITTSAQKCIVYILMLRSSRKMR